MEKILIKTRNAICSFSHGKMIYILEQRILNLNSNSWRILYLMQDYMEKLEIFKMHYINDQVTKNIKLQKQFFCKVRVI